MRYSWCLENTVLFSRETVEARIPESWHGPRPDRARSRFRKVTVTGCSALLFHTEWVVDVAVYPSIIEDILESYLLPVALFVFHGGSIHDVGRLRTVPTHNTMFGARCTVSTTPKTPRKGEAWYFFVPCCRVLSCLCSSRRCCCVWRRPEPRPR